VVVVVAALQQQQQERLILLRLRRRRRRRHLFENYSRRNSPIIRILLTNIRGVHLPLQQLHRPFAVERHCHHHHHQQQQQHSLEATDFLQD
jgi:hypothetical protein